MVLRSTAFIVAMLLASVASAQTHTPSHTVDGRRVTVDADICFWDAGQNMDGFTLVQGTPLMAASIAASKDGTSPIIWEVPPGTYQMTAYGFPDDRMNPERQTATLNIVADPVPRDEAIREALIAWFVARSTLQQLNPTRQELLDGLNP